MVDIAIYVLLSKVNLRSKIKIRLVSAPPCTHVQEGLRSNQLFMSLCVHMAPGIM